MGRARYRSNVHEITSTFARTELRGKEPWLPFIRNIYLTSTNLQQRRHHRFLTCTSTNVHQDLQDHTLIGNAQAGLAASLAGRRGSSAAGDTRFRFINVEHGVVSAASRQYLAIARPSWRLPERRLSPERKNRFACFLPEVPAYAARPRESPSFFLSLSFLHARARRARAVTIPYATPHAIGRPA